jgi:hypothetical protein
MMGANGYSCPFLSSLKASLSLEFQKVDAGIGAE